jgi:hypothetical protein
MANPFAGRRVAAMVALLVVLTAVIPPAAAYGLARWRVSRAGELAAAAAGPLAARKQELKDAAGTQAVVCGPGRLPDAAGPGREWLQSPVAAGDAFGADWPQDPWGRCFLLNVRGVLESGGGLLISAGPNGTIDTPLHAASPAGDDIAALVR